VNAWQIGLVNFSSFLIAGALLLPYIVAIHEDHGMLFWSAIIGVVQLFALSYVKGMIIARDGEGKRKSGLETLLMGAAVTIIGVFIGSLFGK
jgi:VIT1/CCC1 family predicted Fe2+/Mn2+ transporter